eukprot:4028609-Prymnesium_polylepis.1
MWPSEKRSSTRVRSARVMPAWCIAKPYGSSSARSLFLVVSASVRRISREAESSRRKSTSVSLASAMSRMARPVLAHSLREWTKTSTCRMREAPLPYWGRGIFGDAVYSGVALPNSRRGIATSGR